MEGNQVQPDAGASPEFRREKRKREEEPGANMSGPSGKKNANTSARDDAILRAIGQLPTREDIGQLEVSIRAKIQTNATAIARLERNQAEDRANFNTMAERIFDRKMAESGKIALTPVEEAEEANYRVARRSLRMWPIRESPQKTLLDQFKEFCEKVLKVPKDTIE